MADVVLVQPTICFSDSVRTRPALPLGIMHISALLQENYKVKIIDQRVDADWKKNLKNEIKKSPIFIGLTAKTGDQIYFALEISRYIKSLSGIPVVWGGVHGSFFPEQTLKDKNIDIVVRGDGETTSVELAEKIQNSKDLKKVKGISYKYNEKVQHNPDRELVDLNKIPAPPLNLINLRDYLQTYLGQKSLTLQSSRGCIRSCQFCYNTVFNKGRWRALTAKKTIERIQDYKDAVEVENIYIIDDNFFIDLRRGEEFAERLIKEKMEITWQPHGTDFSSAISMSDRYIRLLKKSGLTGLKLGVESGSPRIRNLLNKQNTVDEIIDVNRKFRKYKIMMDYNFMAGFPTETIQDINKTVSLMKRLIVENPNARSYGINFYTPYPHTHLYELAIKKGFIPPKTLRKLAEYKFDSALVENPEVGHIDQRTLKYIKNISFLAPFLDNKSEDYDINPLFKLIYNIYSPLARFRLNNKLHGLLIERDIARIVRKNI